MRNLLLTVAALSTLSFPALAQQPCAPADEVNNGLAQNYHEVPVAEGVNDDGTALMVLYSSPNGETWTLVVVRAADKMACMAASGQNLQMKKPEEPKAPEEGL